MSTKALKDLVERWRQQLVNTPNTPANRKAKRDAERKQQGETITRRLQRFSNKFKD
jgi:hypothetical protein